MSVDYIQLTAAIREWGDELGFSQTVIAPIDLSRAEGELLAWLDAGYHGEMAFMARHGTLRSRPDALVPGTQRVICVRLDYLPGDAAPIDEVLDRPPLAYVSRYALGRDYHKLMRKRLGELARRIETVVGPRSLRPFVDSAPVLEKPLAALGGLGWRGKHTNLVSRTGSWFFIGELFVDLPLPVDSEVEAHCGDCHRCLDLCPTQAIIAPYRLDARRCISYLTIEHPGSIPEALRPLIGNRIYGCDDCQWVCPWNRFATVSQVADFSPRKQLDRAHLIDLFQWDEATFLRHTEGSAIRRIGHSRWLRNIALAMGNAEGDPDLLRALLGRRHHPDPIVREQVRWSLTRQISTRRNASPH